MSSRYGRGWFGQSGRHSLAARGVVTAKAIPRSYSASKAVEPMFYARKRESDLPFSHIAGMVRDGKSYSGMQSMHPGADQEDLRLRGIKAIEMLDMDKTLSTVDKHGVDKTVSLAQSSPRLKVKVVAVLSDRQKGSFIADIKREAILRRLV